MIENLQTDLEKELTRNGESSGIQEGVFIWPMVMLALMALTTIAGFESKEIEVAKPLPRICPVEDQRRRYMACLNRLNDYRRATMWHYGNCEGESSSCLRT